MSAGRYRGLARDFHAQAFVFPFPRGMNQSIAADLDSHRPARDLLAALARGTAAGGITGLLAGMLAMTFPPAGLAIAAGALLALTAGGAGFGAWMAAMIGVDVPNSQLKRFEQAITAGNLLMLVDIPRDRQTPIEAVIRDGFPAAEFTVSRPTSGVEVA